MSEPFVALFPGQGAQSIGMGKDFFDNFKVAREAFEEASEGAKLKMDRLCFDGPESDLILTSNLQPALLTVSVAAFRVAAKELGISPRLVMGHSLGEYSALVAAGSFSLFTAASLVRSRGQAMQEAVPEGEGGMAAVMGLNEEDVLLFCKAVTERADHERSQGIHESGARGFKVKATLEPANFNADGQIVVAGSSDAIEVAVKMVKESAPIAKGAKIIPLKVSAPFHCSLMKPARNKMNSVFSNLTDSTKPQKLQVPYISNFTGRMTSEASVILEFLEEQIDHPVLWKQSMHQAIGAGYTKAIEFGPGKVLAGLAKRCALNGVSVQVFPCGESNHLKGLELFSK